MKQSKRLRLERAGWKVGSVQEFLGLTDEEMSLIEMRLALVVGIKSRRLAQGLTQQELAKRLGSSQSRVAKIEASDTSVSIELLIRSLLALGATRHEVGQIIGRKASATVA